jgi:hypothetical protein
MVRASVTVFLKAKFAAASAAFFLVASVIAFAAVVAAMRAVVAFSIALARLFLPSAIARSSAVTAFERAKRCA